MHNNSHEEGKTRTVLGPEQNFYMILHTTPGDFQKDILFFPENFSDIDKKASFTKVSA